MAFGRILAYHGHEGTPPDDLVDGGVTRPPPDPARASGPASTRRAAGPATPRPSSCARRRPGWPASRSIALCVPPAADGRIDDATLCAAAVAGVDEVYRIGGAQAIAAMAYGTRSVPAVDVIAGPGNAYVAEAKRQVSGVVGVASAFAGPSEIVVVAGPERRRRASPPSTWWSRPSTGPTGWPGWSPGTPIARRGDRAEVDRIVAASRRRADLESTLATAGHRLPGRRPRAGAGGGQRRRPRAPAADGARRGGRWRCSTWCRTPAPSSSGDWSPASMGDYVAGPNHVLPTNRTARFASALRADDFRKHIHAVRVTPDALRALGPHVVTLAEAEGLPAHADSVRRRLAALDDEDAP